MAGDDDDRRESDRLVPVQEQLPLDEPVPYRLTTVGRRLIAPDDEPELRVVPSSGGAQPPRGRATDLDQLDPQDRARARAMRRGGMHTLDIAAQLGVDAIHVEQWISDLPVPVRPGRRRTTAARPTSAATDGAWSPDAAATVVATWRAARDAGRDEAERRLRATPTLRSGLGLVAGILEQDHHALLLTGDDLDVIAAAWRWIATTLAVADAPVRVLVRHDPASAGDRVAHEVATAMGLSADRLTTTRDPARTGQPPATRLRVADPTLAGRVAGWRRALLVEVADPPDTRHLGA